MMSETTEEQRAAWMQSDGEHLNARCVKMLLRDYDSLARELAEARTKLTARDWTPITPENLPKHGKHEVGLFTDDGCVIYEVNNFHALFTAEKWKGERGMTHFRPVNAPKPDAEQSNG